MLWEVIGERHYEMAAPGDTPRHLLDAYARREPSRSFGMLHGSGNAAQRLQAPQLGFVQMRMQAPQEVLQHVPGQLLLIAHFLPSLRRARVTIEESQKFNWFVFTEQLPSHLVCNQATRRPAGQPIR